MSDVLHPLRHHDLQVALDAPAPGEYALYICGCAPTYSTGDLGSPALNNDSVYVAVNGAPLLLPGSEVAVPVAGFGETADFIWRIIWRDEMTGETGPARFTFNAGGPQMIELSMAEDGLLVYSVVLAPVDGAEPVNGESCTP